MLRRMVCRAAPAHERHIPQHTDGHQTNRRAQQRCRSAATFVGRLCVMGVAAIGLLSACALSPTRGSDAAQPTRAQADTAPEAQTQTADPAQEGLSATLLFQIMAAEVAAQRGEAGTAYLTFLSLARQTQDARLARRAVEIALSARAFKQAQDAAQLWAELAPDSDQAAQTYGVLLVADQQLEKAESVYKPWLAKDPIKYLLPVQRALLQAPDRKAGFELLERLAQPALQGDALQASQAQLILATGAQAAGMLDRAAQAAREAYRLRPDDAATVVVAAQYIEANVDPRQPKAAQTQAAELLRLFVQQHPKEVLARLAYARALVRADHFKQATQEFETVLAQDADNLEALYALGILALEAPPHYSLARDYFMRYLSVLERTPNTQRDPALAYLHLARIAEHERQFDQALDWLRRVEPGPQWVNARTRLAVLLAKTKQADKADAVLDEIEPEDEETRRHVLQARAQVLSLSGKEKQAYALLADALAADPDQPHVLYDIAMIAQRLNQIDLMEKHLKRLIELEPADAHAHNALGYTWADRNMRLDEAQVLLERAYALAPNDAAITDSLGWLYYRKGDLARARDLLERAYQLLPDAEIGTHLGEVYWALGQHRDARRVWQAVHRLDPDNPVLHQTLKRLKARL